MENEIIKIISQFLKSEVTISSSRSDFDAWDSLRHVDIIFAIEEEFDIFFSEADLETLDDVKSFVAAVNKQKDLS